VPGVLEGEQLGIGGVADLASAMRIGPEAVGPVFAASLGAILFTMAAERKRGRKRQAV
jgi:hypothetical protein